MKKKRPQSLQRLGRYGPENVPVEKLPKTLFPGGLVVPLGEHDPESLDVIAAKPPAVRPMPHQWSASKKRRMAGLAQYRGRTLEGNKRSLANLPRKVKMSDLDPIDIPLEVPLAPNDIKVPLPPTMIPKVPAKETVSGKYLRRIVSQDEARLFQETYLKWMSAHPEWDSPEDEDDVKDICLELVIMHRLQAVQRQNPSVDIAEAYNQSFNRKQKARENLMARRKDKVGAKNSHSKRIPNVAEWAGELSPEKMAEKMLEEKVRAAQEEDDFLNKKPKGQPDETAPAGE